VGVDVRREEPIIQRTAGSRCSEILTLPETPLVAYSATKRLQSCSSTCRKYARRARRTTMWASSRAWAASWSVMCSGARLWKAAHLTLSYAANAAL
jgi:hypothetical protein